MHVSSAAVWPLVALLARCVAVADAAAGGVVEVDLMFPRNETYAPSDYVPVVFAIQNAALATHLNIDVHFRIYNQSHFHNQSLLYPPTIASGFHMLKWDNLSASEPYFFDWLFHQQMNLHAEEGRWTLAWNVFWQSCDEGSFTGSQPRHGFFSNMSSDRYIDFAVQHGAQPMDLIAASADGKPCPALLGVAINVTRTVSVPPAERSNWDGGNDDWVGNDTCAVVVAEPKPTANPCHVKVDSAALARMSASREAGRCSAPRGNCGSSSAGSVSQPLAVAGVASLAVMVGALGFFSVWI